MPRYGSSRGGRSWNTDGVFSLELYLDDGGVVRDAAKDQTNSTIQKLAPQIAKNEDKWCEIVIYFNSEGYHEPASMYGGADRLGWPEEGSDERSLIRAEINDDTSGKQQLPPDFADELFEQYRDQIEEVEIESRDEPDYDDLNDDVQRLAATITEDPDIQGNPAPKQIRGFAIKYSTDNLLEILDEDGRASVCVYKTEEEAHEAADRSDLDDYELIHVIIRY